MHTWTVEGEREVMPPAETYLAERAAERLAAAGLMTLQSIKGRNAVRLAAFQSAADPPGALVGRWA